MSIKKQDSKTSIRKKKRPAKVDKVIYSNRNIGFSIEVPDNWVEVKKSSYEDLGINDNTLFIFTTDKFSAISAIFSGYCDKRKFNKTLEKYKFDKFKVIYNKEEVVNDLPVYKIVLDDNNKKILNCITLINGMIINFTINIDLKNRLFDSKGVTTDNNFKIMKEILASIKVFQPVNPPKYLVDIVDEEVPEIKEITKHDVIKSAAQIEIETDCKYKNIFVPDYYFKYVYRANDEALLLSVINDEIFFSGFNDEFRYFDVDKEISTIIYKILSMFWQDLSKFDIGNNKPTNNSNWVIKNKSSYMFVELNEESNETLAGIFNLIVLILREKSKINFYKYDIFPNFDKYIVKDEDDDIVFSKNNKYLIDIDEIIGNHEKAAKVKKMNQDNKVTFSNDNKYLIDIDAIIRSHENNSDSLESKVEKVEFDDEKNNVDNKYFIDFESIFNEKKDNNSYSAKDKKEFDVVEDENLVDNYDNNSVDENKYYIDLEKIDKVKHQDYYGEEDNKYRINLDDIFQKNKYHIDLNKIIEQNSYVSDIGNSQVDDNDNGDNSIVSEHVYTTGNKYSISVTGDPEDLDKVEKHREFNELPFVQDNYEYYYHNISGHGLFKFLFPKRCGVKVIRDFNVFDIQDKGILKFRVFLYKCNNEEEYLTKLNSWMEKNFSSDSSFLLDKYENNQNSINIKTFILSNDKFYKVAYIQKYMVVVSAENNERNLFDANIALDKLEISKSDNEFVEAYDRKMNSIALLQEQEIPFIWDLPEIKNSHQVILRDFDEVAKRAIVLCVVCNFASDVINSKKKRYIKDSKKFFTKLLNQFGVSDYLTKDEKELFNKMDKELALQLSWQFEGYLILLWALGLVEEIPFPDTLVEPDEVTAIVSNCNSYREFTSKCLYRDVKDILDLADLTYRYDWYCVDSEENGLDPVINPEVVIERHRAVNWLIDPESWENVEVNT